MQPRATPVAEAVRAEFSQFFEPTLRDGRYRNPWQHEPLPGLAEVLRWKTGQNRARARGYRAQPLRAAADGLSDFTASSGAPTRLFWIGHASFLLELDGQRFVIDPIFGRAGGVVPRVTPPAAAPDQLRGLSAVLVTHGHHDHLDPSGLRALAEANGGETTFVVPRGLAATLPEACRPRVELDWWQYVEFGPVRAHLVPAQHWHRRGAFDLNKGLWGGYVLEGTHRVYHSGDTGYFAGFRAIGAVFGGIDAACLPLGAYEPRWFMAAQHMSPDQSLDAQRELAASHFVGMHWGAYDLSDEPIDAGPQLARQLAAERGSDPNHLHIIAPGGSLSLDGPRGATRAEVRHAWTPDERA
jgi:L-ascorbate metabolism protein UlaG (beta-lactamase superfamily)